MRVTRHAGRVCVSPAMRGVYACHPCIQLSDYKTGWWH
jgi:hypothetical protein